MIPFTDTHAHLIHNADWQLMDEIAESGVLKQAWLMHIPWKPEMFLPPPLFASVLMVMVLIPLWAVAYGWILL